MTPRSTRGTLRLIAVAAWISTGWFAEAADERAMPDSPINCGPAALFALGAVERREIDFDKLVARLPQRREGHSMKELRDAARSFGLNLQGLFVGKRVDLIDRPMLVFVKDQGAKIEHFLVIRPVGHTGSLVQLIDSNGPPRIIEKADMVASSQWTGIVLAPARSSWTYVAGLGLLAASALLALGLLMAWRTKQSARRVLAPS